MMAEADSGDIHVSIVTKGNERYVFLYRYRYLDALDRVFGRYASNPELSFNWHDAATIALAIKKRSSSEFL